MATSPHWPAYLPRTLVRPQTTLWFNLEVTAARFPERSATAFFGRELRYRELKQAAERFAGWLASRAGVAPGERVAIYLQNSPQWLISYYGTLRAGAVVVPINPMLRAPELRKQLDDSAARVLVCAQELAEQAVQAVGPDRRCRIVVATYADHLPSRAEFDLPDWIAAPRQRIDGCDAWRDVIDDEAAALPAMPSDPEALATLNYTSGSTGEPKGCMHTHQTIMHTTVGLAVWHGHPPGTVFLGVAPMYQVAGLINVVNSAVYVGGTIVPLPRWDRRLAAQLMARYRVRFAGIAPTGVIDLLGDLELDRYDLSSLRRISFGGASMPEAVWQQLRERLGVEFIEAYGLTETAATTHINPIHRPKRQCLGLPFFDTESRIVHPETLAPCAAGEPGEILIRGPQLFRGYWQRPQATDEAFADIDGTRWFRSGDIGYVDDEGYFFMTDRLKRMINASGFKVWPAEVESVLYAHPDVQEACVISARDPYRGETVKAVIVLRPARRGQVREEDIVSWARERMAAYKYPRVVEFADSLPKSPVGKILWRQLQETEDRRASPPQP